MKHPVRNFFKLLLFIFVILLAWNFKTLCYGIGQLTGQLKIVFNAVPVEDAIKDATLDSSLRKKLLLIQEIRQFATDSLGLKKSENYTTFYNQHDKPLLWVVTGCLPYRLSPKKWWFPFIGSVSYKGFFKENKSKKEAEKIQRQGYETDIYSPAAWSTLGFLKDPVLSGFLKRSYGRIAELIIHELTHETVYLKSSVDFNENFATFTGEKGAELFLKMKFGENSKELKNYRNSIRDEEVYSNYMLSSSKSLDSLYATFAEDIPVKEKATVKYRKIASIMLGINKLPLISKSRYRYNFKSGVLPNNTEFMSFLRYRKKQQTFNELYKSKYHSDLKYFITDITKKTDDNSPLPFELE
jgi:predicted aminopeptidase